MSQIARLEEVFELLDEKVRGKHCEGIAGIIEEGKAILEEDFEGDTLDACLIAAGQRAEHYEIAAYQTLVAWARVMNMDEAAALLEDTLKEEKAADEKLSGLADCGINENAFDAAAENEDSDASDDAPDAPARHPPPRPSSRRSVVSWARSLMRGETGGASTAGAPSVCLGHHVGVLAPSGR